MTSADRLDKRPPTVTVNEVTYTYAEGARPALDGITLEVRAGEFLGVVGGNGSGKSTLALIMTGLLTPERGTVRWPLAGAAAGSATDTASRIATGIVFQDPDDQLVGTLVGEDVAFGPSCLGLDRPEMWQRVDAALHLTGAARFRHRAPHHLSVGERQRVAMADVLALQPRCLVLDEPTAMLDAPAQVGLRRLVGDMRTRHTAVVWITHDLKEVMAADRVVVLHHGRIVFAAPPVELPSDPERMAAWGLQLPPVMELGRALQQAGVPIPTAFDEATLLEGICRLWPIT